MEGEGYRFVAEALFACEEKPADFEEAVATAKAWGEDYGFPAFAVTRLAQAPETYNFSVISNRDSPVFFDVANPLVALYERVGGVWKRMDEGINFEKNTVTLYEARVRLSAGG